MAVASFSEVRARARSPVGISMEGEEVETGCIAVEHETRKRKGGTMRKRETERENNSGLGVLNPGEVR